MYNNILLYPLVNINVKLIRVLINAIVENPDFGKITIAIPENPY